MRARLILEDVTRALSYQRAIDLAKGGRPVVVLIDGRLWSNAAASTEVVGDRALTKRLRAMNLHYARKTEEIRKVARALGRSQEVTHVIKVWINCAPGSVDATVVDLRSLETSK